MRLIGRIIPSLRPLTPLLRAHPWGLPAIVALGVSASLAEGLGISLFIPLLHGVFEPAGLPETGSWFVDRLGGLFERVPPERRLTVLGGAILGAIVVRSVLVYAASFVMRWLESSIGHRLRTAIYDQLLVVGYHFLEKSDSGRLFNTLATETWRTTQAMAQVVQGLIIVCTLCVYTVLLLLISWQLTVVVIVAMLAISGVVRLITRNVKRLGREVTQTNQELANRMVEGVWGMKVIRSFAREDYEKGRFEQASRRVSDLVLKLQLLSESVTPVYETLAAVVFVGLLALTVREPEQLPVVLVFVALLYRLQPKVVRLDSIRLSLASLTGAVEEVSSVLDRRDKPYVVPGRRPFEGLREGVAFERVGFSYGGEGEAALQEVSFALPAGKTTALVGPSGAGKSTIAKLILRLYDTTSGEILVDGVPLRELDLTQWRGRIAVVSQDVYVFDTTVAENIAYGRPGATMEEIVSAAKRADAHGFISAMPEGYGTRVGHRGVRLSGGQLQRLTLARAIICDPDLLILDEATNSLDSISESVIQEALAIFGKDRTVLMIAHRLATIAEADQVLVLDRGRLVEQGTVQSLLERDGLFGRLYRLQNRELVS